MSDSSGSDLAMSLPAAEVSRFGALFAALDDAAAALGVTSYGVSATTMEHVFLQASADTDGDGDAEDAGYGGGGVGVVSGEARESAPFIKGDDAATERKVLLTGGALMSQQFRALLLKRALHAVRDKKAWLSQIVLPALFVCLALLVATTSESPSDLPELELTTAMFGDADGGGAGNVIPLADYTGASAANLSGRSVGEAVLAAARRRGGGSDVFVDVAASADGGMTGYMLRRATQLNKVAFGGLSVDDALTDDRFLHAGAGNIRNLTIWFKNRGPHAMPTYLNLATNALIGAEHAALAGEAAPHRSVTTVSHPFPKTQSMLADEFSRQTTDLTVAVFVIIAMSFVPASFVVYIVEERVVKSKHLQLVSSVSRVQYWLAARIGHNYVGHNYAGHNYLGTGWQRTRGT